MMRADQSMVVQALERMKPRSVDAWMYDNHAYLNSLRWQALAFPAMALPDPDNPVVIFGVVHEFGVGEVWMITGEGFEEKAKQVLPMQRMLCASMYKALNLHRLCLAVAAGRKDAEKWAEKLGFEFETVLQRASARGEDLSIYLWPDERSASWED